jgi:ribosomal protein S18 acetylase RimI-like enzyme
VIGSDKRFDKDVFTLSCSLLLSNGYRALGLIRDFDEKPHLAGVRACLIELQDFERSLDSRIPSGAKIVDEYIPQMLSRCVECDGKILVAELNEEVAGFVTIFAKVSSGELADGDIEYGLISDIVVASKYRKQGIGKKLLAAAEEFARSSQVSSLRIGVLAKNHLADELYDSMGFEILYLEREKKLSGS